MKASGYFANLADFELFISEMTVQTKQLKQINEEAKKVSDKKWFKKTDDIIIHKLLSSKYTSDLQTLNNCYNLLLFNRGQGHVTVNIPVEATEMYFQWFKGKVDECMMKH